LCPEARYTRIDHGVKRKYMDKVRQMKRVARSLPGFLLLLSFLLAGVPSASGASVNLTQNWGFEEGFKANGVGLGWNPFVLSGNVTFANTIEYFWPGAEHTEGETSQLLISKTAFSAGLYQQIGGVTVGNPYGAKAAMLTLFESSAPPTNDGTMQKLVGIDPYGGTNPNSPHIVWSPVDDHDEAPWVDVRVAAVAMSSTITLFVRVNCLQPVSHPSLDNQVFVDAVMLTQAPTVSASSPPVSYSPTFTVTWANGQPAPGGYIVKYDVEYKDDVHNTWILWQYKTRDASAQFTGLVGTTYTFRARAYERYTAWYDVRLVGAWSNGDTTTKVATIGGVEGYVKDNRDIPLLSATVNLVGTGISSDTRDGGHYSLTPSSTGTYDMLASGLGYHAPPEIRDVEIQYDVVALDFTLRPRDDVVQNGDFEEGLTNWLTVAGSLVAPVVTEDEVRSGSHSLALGKDSTTSGTCALTQTLYVTPTMYMPTLSFWYRAPATGSEGDDSFEVGIYHGDPWAYHALLTVDPSQQWTHAWVDVSPYTGTAWISFSYHRDGSQDFTVYLDEVSLGRASGGPNRAYLPLCARAG
jgi:hypothetical protein